MLSRPGDIILAFKAGREEAAAKARERTQFLKKKLQERQALKKEVNKLVIAGKLQIGLPT